MFGISEKMRDSAVGIGGKRRLLSSCAVAAILASATAPSPACAQAFNAVNNTPTQLNAIVSNDGATGTSVYVTGSQAVIDWEPNNTALAANNGTGAIDFLPAGHTVTYESGYGFTVLNRINGADADLTRPITLDGEITSRVNGEQGGNVWFYSPAGIIAGPNALFNVGGLLLTTGVVDTTGGLYGNGPSNSGPASPQGGAIRISSPDGSQSAVVISDTAQINALADGSYVAVVAPRITQAGSVNVRGGVAYVASEGATIGFSTDGGLISALVSGGTQVGAVAGDNVTLMHSGTTTGPGSGGASDPHNIFFVILPKNDAVTMLLSGTIGYQAAFNASVQNGVIVLGAGAGVDNIAVPEASYSGVPSATFNGNIDIAGGTFQSDVTGFYTGGATISSRLGDLTFTKSLMVRPVYDSSFYDYPGIGDVTLAALNGHNLTVEGDLSLFASRGRIAQASTDAGSVLRINGDALISASQPGLAETGYGPYIPATDGTGATALLTANGGAVILAGALDLEAEGLGGFGGMLAGGMGTGGTARLTAQAGGSVSVAGAATIDARGQGGNSNAGDGGAGTGGTASVVANGGTVTFAGGAQVLALGTGGDTANSVMVPTAPGVGPARGGLGTGGTASIGAQAGGSVTSSGVGLINILANGTGGASDLALGGLGAGGNASLTADGASISLAGETEVDADGTGGESEAGTFDGPAGSGGVASAAATANGTILVAGMNVAARGQSYLNDGGVGGTVSLVANQAAIEADTFLNLFTVNNGTGGTGGTVTVAATGSGGVTVDGPLQLFADTATVTHAGPTRNTIDAESVYAVVGASFSANSFAVIRASDGVEIDAGTSITTGNIAAGGAIELNAGTTAALGNLTAVSDIDVTAPGGITAGAVASGDTAQLISTAGAITATSVAGGVAGPNGDPDFAGNVGIGARDSVTVGGVSAFAYAGLLSQTAGVSATSVTAHDAAILAEGNVGVGTATTTALFYVGSPAATQTVFDPAYVLGQANDPTPNIPALIAGGVTRAGGNVGVTGLLTAGQLMIGAGGTIKLASTTITGSAALDAGTDVRSSGPLSASLATIGAGGNITLASATVSGNATFNARGVLDAEGLAIGGSLTAQGSAVTLAGTGPLNIALAHARSGNLVIGLDNGDLNIANATATSDLNATAYNGSATVAAVSAGGVLAVRTRNGVNLANATAGGDIYASASEGIATVSNATAGGSFEVDGRTGVSLANVTARGDIGTIITNGGATITAATLGGALSVDAQTEVGLTGATAGKTIDVKTRGTVSLAGDIAAPAISIRSGDIAIDPAARVGIDTGSITLSNLGGGGAMHVGGGEVANTWSLSNGEFGRLSAETITINAQAAEDFYSLEIGQLDIIGSAGADTASRRRNLQGSSLVFNAGSTLVDGAVKLTGAGAADTLSINTVFLLNILTPSGSIALSGPTGALAGTLNLAADTIFVGSQQASTDLAALTSIGARNTRLGTNDGAVNPAGFIQAGGLKMTGATGIYIQNTGTTVSPDTRAGFTVGSGGVTIVKTGQTPTELIINGRQESATAPGGYVTGAALIPLLNLPGGPTNPTLGFAHGSTVNSCLLDGTPCGVVRMTGTDIPPVQDVINTSLDPSAQLAFLVQTPPLELSDTVSVALEPLIDDPVTGAGNEDMWLGSSDLDDERKKDKDKARGTAN